MEKKQPCALINTARLKPFRQKFNRVIMTITDSGHVSMEMMGTLEPNTHGQEIVKELFHVSPDGKQVEVYQDADGVAALDGCPMPCQPNKVFTYPDLPAKQWKKYLHTYKFVDVVKSRTAKVTLITERAKCRLMENAPHADFQVSFNDGVNILLTKSTIQITDKDGGTLSFDVESLSSRVSPETVEMVEFVKQCHNQCLEIEKSVSTVSQSGQEIFPITVGTSTSPFQLSPVNTSRASSVLSNSETLRKSSVSDSTTYESVSSSQAPSNLKLIAGHSQSAEGHAMYGLNSELSYSTTQQANCDDYEKREFLNVGSDKDYNMLLPAHHQMCADIQSDNLTSYVPYQQIPFDANVAHQICNHSGDPYLHSVADSAISTGCHSLTHEQAVAHFHQQAPVSSCYAVVGCGTPQKSRSNSHDFTDFNTPQKSVQSYVQETFSDLAVQHSMPPFSNFNTPSTSNQDNTSYSHSNLSTPQKPVYDNRQYTVNVYNTPQKSAQTSIPLTAGNDFNVPNYFVPNAGCDFTTPKRPTCPPSLQCYSVDSMRQRNVVIRKQMDLSLDALVPSENVAHVKRNLFCDQTLAEPAISPAPSIIPHSLGSDIIACRPTPSLELSFCNDGDDGQNIENVNNSAASQPSSKDIGETLPKVLEENRRESLHQSEMCLLEKQCEQSLNIQDRDNSVIYEEVSDLVFHRKGSIEEKMFPASPMKTPKKSIPPVRKVACISPTKTPLRRPYSEPQGMSSHHGSFLEDSSNTTSSQSAGNHQLPKPTKDSLNRSSSDSGFQSHRPASTPFSPQKEFVMPQDLSGRAFSLPPHFRNSLDISASSYFSDSPSSTVSSSCDPIRQVFVPYTGWASVYVTGAVWILYNDGTQLGVKSTEASMIYIDQDGIQHKYQNSDSIPEIVKLKLEKLPAVIDKLMKSPTESEPAYRTEEH